MHAGAANDFGDIPPLESNIQLDPTIALARDTRIERDVCWGWRFCRATRARRAVSAKHARNFTIDFADVLLDFGGQAEKPKRVEQLLYSLALDDEDEALDADALPPPPRHAARVRGSTTVEVRTDAPVSATVVVEVKQGTAPRKFIPFVGPIGPLGALGGRDTAASDAVKEDESETNIYV